MKRIHRIQLEIPFSISTSSEYDEDCVACLCVILDDWRASFNISNEFESFECNGSYSTIEPYWQWHLKRLYRKFEVKLFMDVDMVLFYFKNMMFSLSGSTVFKQSSQFEVFVWYSSPEDTSLFQTGALKVNSKLVVSI